MQAATNRLEFAPPPPPGLLRAFALAILAHAFLLAALTWGVHWKRQDITLSAEAELWSAVPQQAAPKLVERPPEPAERQPPSQPVKVTPVPVKVEPVVPKVDIALERAKRLQQEKLLAQEKAEQERLALEKLKLQKKLEQERKAAEDKKKAEIDSKAKEALKAQQEAESMEAQRKENIKRMTGLAGASGSPSATGSALQSSGPSAGYAGRIRAAIKPNIVFTEDVSGNPMAEVEVRTAPNGTIISHKLLKSSGIKAWDEAVLKAIDKTGDLPRDVDGKVPPTLVISFRPKD
ncbi:MAG: cell envelope integrity protein TolA [Rhodoferax sp.]|nr:cell envelope integrity protein TolA [Rhodoferax sp.]